MATLEKLYEKPSTSNKVFLMKHLFNMKMSKDGFVAGHLNEFNTIISLLSFVGVNFDDCLWTLNFDDVVGAILSEEM